MNKLSIELNSGSLLIMRGTTQHYWKHRIPKAKVSKSERIFRVIHPL